MGGKLFHSQVANNENGLILTKFFITDCQIYIYITQYNASTQLATDASATANLNLYFICEFLKCPHWFLSPSLGGTIILFVHKI